MPDCASSPPITAVAADTQRCHCHCSAPSAAAGLSPATKSPRRRGQKLQAQSQYFPTLTPSYQFQNRTQTAYGLTTGSSNSTTTGTTTGTGTGTGTTGTGTTSTGATGTGSGTTGGTTFSQNNTINEVSTVRGGGLSVSLSQTLLDNGSREAANAEARRAVDAANFGDINTRQNTILTVTQDFYQLLLTADLVKVAQAQVARYQQAVDVTQGAGGSGNGCGQRRVAGAGGPCQRAGDAAARSKPGADCLFHAQKRARRRHHRPRADCSAGRGQ